MTREEARQRLEFLKGVYSVDTETALDMAIEALQCDVVESCEDCPRFADDCDGEVEDD